MCLHGQNHVAGLSYLTRNEVESLRLRQLISLLRKMRHVWTSVTALLFCARSALAQSNSSSSCSATQPCAEGCCSASYVQHHINQRDWPRYSTFHLTSSQRILRIWYVYLQLQPRRALCWTPNSRTIRTGPTFCGAGNCTSTCDRKSECDPGWGIQWSNVSVCPLKVCCSQYGFCGAIFPDLEARPSI